MNSISMGEISLLLPLMLVKVTVFLLIGFGVQRIRRFPASLRHAVWSALLCSIVLLPLLTIALPRWSVEFRSPSPVQTALPVAASGAEPVNQPMSSAPSSLLSGTNSSQIAGAQGGELPAKPLPQSLDVRAIVIQICSIAWFIGFAFVLGRLGIGLLAVRRIRLSSKPAGDRTLRIADDARRSMGVRPHVAVLNMTGGSIGVPITWGVFRPVVALPAGSVSWSDDCLRTALLHEFAHVKRSDWLQQMAATFACAVYWFHPLIWLAARSLREESERACDDCVLCRGVPPADYAQSLVDVVRSLPDGYAFPVAAIGMAAPSEIERRLRGILATGSDRREAGQRHLAAIAIVAAAILLPLAALRLTAIAKESALTAVEAPLPGAQTKRIARYFLSFAIHGLVATPRFPNRPITCVVSYSAGRPRYRFTDRRTGRSFRDIAQIRADYALLVGQGVVVQPGAQEYITSPDLDPYSRPSLVYFTAGQRMAAANLMSEMQDYRSFAKGRSFIVRNDGIKPESEAKDAANGPIISFDWTPEAEAKIKKSLKAHEGEMLCVFVQDQLRILKPIDAGIASIGVSHVDLAGLADTLPEAQRIATRLNEPSGMIYIAPDRFKVVEADHVVYEMARHGGAARTVAGYSAQLSNGYRVDITRVSRFAKKSDKWTFSETGWTPDGRMLPALAPSDQSWRNPIEEGTENNPPVHVETKLTPPQGREPIVNAASDDS